MSGLKWVLPRALMADSLRIMQPHGQRGNEGLALWFGQGDEREVQFTHVVDIFGPGFRTTPLYMSLTWRAMATLTDFADRHGIFLAGQIHSHPGTFVDLSQLDQAHGIRVPDYLSVVCPYYAQDPHTVLDACGVHLFEMNRYRRMGTDELRRRLVLRDAPLQSVRLEVPA